MSSRERQGHPGALYDPRPRWDGRAPTRRSAPLTGGEELNAGQRKMEQYARHVQGGSIFGIHVARRDTSSMSLLIALHRRYVRTCRACGYGWLVGRALASGWAGALKRTSDSACGSRDVPARSRWAGVR